MKLLLTSVGVTNSSIREALVELLGKPVEESRAVQISTALYASPSGPEDASEGEWKLLNG
jgi:dipeptidase E